MFRIRSAMLLPPMLFALLAACGDNGPTMADTCAKAKECCDRIGGACDAISREGDGFEERCDISYRAFLDIMASYKQSACDAINETLQDFVACLSGITCDMISNTGSIAQCDQQARAYCNAKKNSGAFVCGGDYSLLVCDNEGATYGDLRFPY